MLLFNKTKDYWKLNLEINIFSPLFFVKQDWKSSVQDREASLW